MFFGRNRFMNNQCYPNQCPNECERQMDPIEELTITNCVEREFYHEVPHICNYHTHYINKHIYKHTYTPQYTCSSEEVVCNIDPGCCGER